MKWEMEIIPPVSNSSWLVEENRNTEWTTEENKAFENALAMYDKDTPDRWHKVAAMVPGKTVVDVIRQYRELEVDVSKIEAGLVPIPGYTTAVPFTLEWGNTHPFDGFKQSFGPTGKRSSTNRPSEQERKKGVPWTEEEHRLFLLGLKKYGKGDWRNISRNFVMSRTPTQVASHAQKYFIRQLSGGKDKRRASIHDITTVSLNDNHQILSPDSKKHQSPDHSTAVSQQTNSSAAMHKMPLQWNQANDGSSVMQFNTSHGNMFMSPHGVNSYDLKLQAQNMQRGAMHDSYLGCQNMVFPMQSTTHQYHNA